MTAQYTALSRYVPMWICVMFDLPTNTKMQRKAAADFRKFLMQDGFIMMQYSVYTRNCPTSENVDVHIQRVMNMLPEDGVVSIMKLTDRQFSDIRTFVGQRKTSQEEAAQQLEIL